MVSPLYGQRVYADTSALIYTLEAQQLYPRLRTHFLELVAREELELVTSWITFAEVLVKPVQTNNTAAEAAYRAFFLPSINFEILPVDKGIADTNCFGSRASRGTSPRTWGGCRRSSDSRPSSGTSPCTWGGFR